MQQMLKPGSEKLCEGELCSIEVLTVSASVCGPEKLLLHS